MLKESSVYITDAQFILEVTLWLSGIVIWLIHFASHVYSTRSVSQSAFQQPFTLMFWINETFSAIKLQWLEVMSFAQLSIEEETYIKLQKWSKYYTS